MTTQQLDQNGDDRARLLAQRLDRARSARGRGARSAGPRPGPMPRTERPPLSFAQQRLWFLDRLIPGNLAYTMQDTAYRLRGELDTAALERAWQAVEERHEVLRSRFGNDGDQPHVVVDPTGTVPLEHLDLSRATDPEQAAREHTQQQADRPFDLTTGPLTRAHLLHLGPQDHILLITVHHSIFDGWSINVLENDLTHAYHAALAHQPPTWPQLPLHYTDFASWQRQTLTGPTLQNHLDHWKTQLTGAPPALELPQDHPRPAVPTHHGGTVHRTIDTHTTDQLRNLSRTRGATLFMTTLAAYQILLARYTRTTDITIGCPSHGRTHPELEPLIGFFVNSLPIRTDLSHNPTFVNHLDHTRDTTLEAFNHQDLPFEQLIEHLAPPRDTSRNPLVQAWFDLFSAESRLQLAGVTVDRMPGGDATTRFDLELHLTGGESGPLGVELVYATDLFEQATMERLADHYTTLLHSIAANPYHQVNDLVMTTPEELTTLLATDPATPPPPHATLTDWFHHRAAESPHATALVHDGDQLTYAELNTRANHIAWTLRQQGHGPETSIALLLPRGIDQITHLLAVLKAGAAYLALDPDHPDDRIHYQLTDSNTRLTITTPEFRHKLPADHPVLLSSHEHPHNPTDPPTTHTTHNHAYTIYTSGTTGRPKGIAMAHEPLLNLLQWQLERAVTNGPTLQFSALNFDISFQEIFSTWLGGGAVVLLDEDARRDPEQMLDIMRTHGVRRLFCPPLVLEQISQAAATATELPPLAEIMTAGEQLHLVGEVRDFIDRLPGVRIDNQYGPSEAHVITAQLLAGDPADWPTAPPVGTAIANTEVYLLDEHGNPTPHGVPGEIHVGGTCLARGYTGRPDLTADRFVPNPYGPPGTRLYRTGDLARHRPWGHPRPEAGGGTLEFLGRADHQVKIRGYRIEPGEIETLLTTHPQIEQAAVVPVEPTPGDLRLAAYYVPAAGTSPTPGDLREFLALTLPAYMLPSHLVSLPALPLTGPGKLDRKALPLPDREDGAGDTYLAPRNPREATIAGIWAEVIKLSKVGVTDDFFEIGGHSLLATKVIARVRAAFDVDLPVRAVFNGRTVAALAEAVAAAERPVLAPLLSKPRDARPPLSFAQQRLWFLDRLQPGMTAYHVFQGYRLRGELDTAALERAWQAVEERHEVLRSRFGNDGDQPHVVVDPTGTVPLEHLDLSRATDPEQAAREHTQQQADRPFDLTTGPLTRAHLLHLGPQDHILLITVHHSIFDGWSINVLENDLTHAYHAALAHQPPTWPQLPLHYTDFASWQRQTLTGPTLQNHLDHWKTQLTGAPPALELPQDHPRPAVPTHHGGTVHRTIDTHTTDQLRNLSRTRGATLFMTTLAAYQILLARYTRTTDITIGCPSHGRTHPELEPLIGFFVNSLPIRTDLSHNPTFVNHLDHTRDTTLEAFNHQDLPFEQLIEHLAPPRDTSRNPLVQAWFQLFQADPEPALDLPGVTASAVPDSDTPATRFDLELHLTGGDTGPLKVELVYATDLFEQATMERLADHYTTLLHSIAANPHHQVNDLVMTTPEELTTLLATDPATPPPPHATLTDWFHHQAAESPHATALVHDGDQLTYAELNTRANHIAWTLRQQGHGPETSIALLLPRGIDQITHLLAVLKAGAAYLPLDPDHPDDRIHYQLTDSNTRLTITTPELRHKLPTDHPVLLSNHQHPHNPTDPPTTHTTHNHAYTIYTSGTTGRPKGVAVQHGSLVGLVDWHLRTYRLGTEDVVSQLANPTFDAATWEIWPTLLSGARLAVPADGVLRDPDALVRHFAEAGTTVTFAPTPVAELLIQRDLAATTRLRALLTGGDLLRPRPSDAPGVPLYNHYGPTEATVVTTASGPLAAPWGRPPIGTAISGAEVYLLDEHGNPTPHGVPGEIHVGGTCLARGYTGRPDLTADRFVPNPYGPPGTRLYRTGDLARHRPWGHPRPEAGGGTLEFLGRADHQVKIRGYRIEPGEIETLLTTHPHIEQAAVVPVEPTPGDLRLAAYIVPTPGANPTPGDLREHLAARLPAYMVPATVTVLDAFPLTSSGKVDRRALPVPALPESRSVEPRDPREEAIAAIWAEVLRRERVGATDDFFEIGGHSLLATQIITRVNREFDVELPVSAAFQYPTVAALGEAVEAEIRAEIAAMSDSDVLESATPWA